MKVEIKNGKAVELNPLGYKPKYIGGTEYAIVFIKKLRDWQQAEDERKVYEIEPKIQNTGASFTYGICADIVEIYEENSIHDAELINETTVRIL